MTEPKVETIELTYAEARLMWLGTETLREANPDLPEAIALDEKVTAAVRSLAAAEGIELPESNYDPLPGP